MSQDPHRRKRIQNDKRMGSAEEPSLPRHLIHLAHAIVTTSQHWNHHYHQGHFYHRGHEEIPSPIYHDHPIRTFFDSVVSFLKQAFYYTCIILILFISSVAWYSLFYMVMMPEQYATESIFFNYNHKACDLNVCPATAIIDLVSSNTQWKAHVPDVSFDDDEEKDERMTCKFSAGGSVQPSELSERDQEYSSVSPSPQATERVTAGRILVPKKSYFIQVALTLPESSNNQEIGMFMIEMDLKSKKKLSYCNNNNNSSNNDNNKNHIPSEASPTLSSSSSSPHSTKPSVERQIKLLASSSRPVMLPYQSTYVSFVKKSVIMVPLILGAIPEARTVIIECFDRFRESTIDPMNWVEIKLVVPNQEHMNGNSSTSTAWKHVHVWKAELRIGKELNRIQWLMKEWFYTCTSIGIACFMVLQWVFWCIAWHFLWIHPKTRSSSSRSHRWNAHTMYSSQHDNEEFFVSHPHDDDCDNDDDNVSGVFIHVMDESSTSHVHDGASSCASMSASSVPLRQDPDDKVPWREMNQDEIQDEDRKSHVWEPMSSQSPCHTINNNNDEISSLKETETIENRNSCHENQHEPAAQVSNNHNVNDNDEKKEKQEKKVPSDPDNSIPQDSYRPHDNYNPKRDNHSQHNIRRTSANQKKKSKKKKKKLSSNKSELRIQKISQQSEDERIMAERVMKGEFGPYEIFTDLDEPE